MERMFIKLSILWVAIALIQIRGYKCCLEKERIAMLEIKAFFKSVSDWHKNRILASWVDDRMSDCCGWEQVKCNVITGRVIELSLNETRQFNDDEHFDDGYPVLDLSLFRHFDELQSLDLSLNQFRGWDENKADFGDLKQLKKLDLSGNWINNNLSPYIRRLTSLRTLILSESLISNKSLQGLENLQHLKILDLSSNLLSDSETWLGLKNLKNLEALDLSFNDVDSLLGLQNLKNLEILNLEGNRMNNPLTWSGICELKNLIELNLMGNEIYGHLPHCLSNLTHLRLLDLSSNQLSGKFSSIIATLTSLEYLSLSYNNFDGLFSFGSLANLSKLEVFTLSEQKNLFQVDMETQLPTKQLKVLTLANCNLHGNISGFLLNQYNLRLIDLSSNKLAEKFPTWLLQNNTKLETMLLMNNSFTGILQVPNSIHGLINLDISNNNFIGQLPVNIGKILPRLESIIMSENSFEGHIPSSIGEMKSLYFLDLYRNNFSGELPRYFLNGCFSLTDLILSDNKFQGQILPKYMNWTQLEILYLDNNQFNGYLVDGLLKAIDLLILNISNNKISGQVPQWIANFSKLKYIFMQNNSLEGNANIQLSNLENLIILDISENSLSGPIMSSFNLSSVNHLYMQRNALNGSIPNSLFKSSILMTLDLRDNEFSGTIPQEISDHSNLNVVLLGGNHLQGHIPNQLCRLKNLNILDLSYNRLSGSIPSCFTNLSFWKEGSGNNKEPRFFGFSYARTGYYSISNYYNSTLHLLESVHNSFGVTNILVEVELVTKNRYDTYKGSILNYMNGLDLSSNKLTGHIPLEFGDLSRLHALNLSNNSLSGMIPPSFSNLKMIESLDLSYNKLTGRVPPQMTELYNLEIFNVSYNNLSGSVPNQFQFGTFEESTYIGNHYLCGSAIKKRCTGTPELPEPSNAREEDESIVDMVVFYWSFAASYITIIFGLIVILWINSYWRMLWFYFINKCISFSF